MNTIESLTGITFDKIAILLGCLLTFPIGHLYLKLNLSDNYKHFYNIFFGMGLGYILMGASGVLHTLISSVVTYMICFHFPSKLAVKLVWIWSLSYMLLAHIIRTINVSNGHFLDYCVIQMMVTTRLTAFASNLYYKNVDQNEYWKKYQFQTLPNILEFLGYIYFYPTYLVGPFIEFVDYNNYIKSRPKPIYKSALYTRITQCIMLLVGLFYLKTYYPVENILKDGFWNLSFGKRFVYLYLASLGYRLSYQFIWTCIHTNMIFIGFAEDLCDFINAMCACVGMCVCVDHMCMYVCCVCI